jgi:hypothetical protein
VTRGAEKFLAFGTWSHRPEQWTSGAVSAVEQDGQLEPVVNPVDITERSPGIVSEPHGGQKPHTPWTRQDGSMIIRHLWAHAHVLLLLLEGVLLRTVSGTEKSNFRNTVQVDKTSFCEERRHSSIVLDIVRHASATPFEGSDEHCYRFWAAGALG